MNTVYIAEVTYAVTGDIYATVRLRDVNRIVYGDTVTTIAYAKGEFSVPNNKLISIKKEEE